MAKVRMSMELDFVLIDRFRRVARRGGISVAAPGFAPCFMRGDFSHLEKALEGAFERLVAAV